MAARLDAQLALLRRDGPELSGSAVAGLPGVPPHQRGQLIAALHVLCRLRGEAPCLLTTEQLQGHLDASCGGLLDALRREWWASGDGGPGSELRAPYTKAATSAWQRDEPAPEPTPQAAAAVAAAARLHAAAIPSVPPPPLAQQARPAAPMLAPPSLSPALSAYLISPGPGAALTRGDLQNALDNKWREANGAQQVKAG